jgi:CRP-like cAMP-binding protein
MILKRTLRPGQIVFYQGEAALQTFRVTAGLVRAYIIHDSGEEATIAYFGPDDLFPIASTFDIAPVTLFYYETVAETTVDVMNRQDIDDYLQAHPVEEVHRFAGRYVGALLHVTALTQTTARAKLAHTLRYLALRFGERSLDKTRYRIPIKLTQQDVARLCNASRETMSIELGRLKNEGVIAVKEKHYIVHFQKLNALISDDATPEIQLS